LFQQGQNPSAGNYKASQRKLDEVAQQMVGLQSASRTVLDGRRNDAIALEEAERLVLVTLVVYRNLDQIYDLTGLNQKALIRFSDGDRQTPESLT
jgi:hypothetical protein